MANATLRGDCPGPFYDVTAFPQTGGFIDGRFCGPSIPGNPDSPICCLPCPSTDWIYPDSFWTYNNVAEWLSTVGFVLLAFALISYVVLPAQTTRKHYLNSCLLVSVMLVELGFIIPLGAKPDQCYNEITPNDMYSSMACAWSGAFILAGALTAVAWVMIRALSMHLQICWDVSPGRRFFYFAQLFGWAFSAAIFTAAITATGVSFRFGSACHINHNHSMADFWAWLIAMGVIAIILQLATMAYCINVYMRNLWSDEPDTTQASEVSAPRYATSSSTRTKTARAVYNRLRRVLWLQWRGLLMVSITLVDVVFFAVVFLYLDSTEAEVQRDDTPAQPWLLCLVANNGDKHKCLDLAQNWLLPMPTIAAVLIMLSALGIQSFIVTFRPAIVTGWKDFVVSKFSHKQEFVSLDALHHGSQGGWASGGPGESSYEEQHIHQMPKGAMFEMQRPGGGGVGSGSGHVKDYGSKDYDSATISTMNSPSDSYNSPMMAQQSHFGRVASPPLRPARTVSPTGPANTRPDYFIQQDSPYAPATSPPPPPAQEQRFYRSTSPQFQHPTPVVRAARSPGQERGGYTEWNPLNSYAQGAYNPPSSQQPRGPYR